MEGESTDSHTRLHDVRKITLSLIADDSFQVVRIDQVGIHIIDNVDDVLNGWTVGVDPRKRRERQLEKTWSRRCTRSLSTQEG